MTTGSNCEEKMTEKEKKRKMLKDAVKEQNVCEHAGTINSKPLQ